MNEPRLPYKTLSPEVYKHLIAASSRLHASPLGAAMVELVCFRVSQINGCAFCLAMHGNALRELGEDTTRLDTLAGWRLSEAFTDRERAALAWVDAVTEIRDLAAQDAAYDGLHSRFTDAEISDLTFAVAIMNAFNRLAISMRV